MRVVAHLPRDANLASADRGIPAASSLPDRCRGAPAVVAARATTRHTRLETPEPTALALGSDLVARPAKRAS